MSHYKEKYFTVPVTKNTHLFAAILCAFGLGRRNFNTWDFSSAYICL